MNLEEIKPGMRVIYIPGVAGVDPTHPACEHGAVNSMNEKYVFVKFDAQVKKLGWEGTTSQSCCPQDLVPEPYDTVFLAEVMQFMMPNGCQRKRLTELPMEVFNAYVDMQKHDCRLESEVLQTGCVSVMISDGEEYVEIEICTNGPEVQKALVDMLMRGRWRPQIGTGTFEDPIQE